jgi:hypothetical protein
VSGEPASAANEPAAGNPPGMAPPEPLRAVHTANFPAMLRRLAASLLVTTYQAGKLALVRDEGSQLNAHYRSFQGPMGLALHHNRLAIGTTSALRSPGSMTAWTRPSSRRIRKYF